MRDLGNRLANRSTLPFAPVRRRTLAVALLTAGLLQAFPAAAQQYISADRNVIIDYGALDQLGPPRAAGPVVIGGQTYHGAGYQPSYGSPLPPPATAPSSMTFVPKPFVPGPITPIKPTHGAATAAGSTTSSTASSSTTASAVTAPPPPSPAPSPVPPLVPSTAAAPAPAAPAAAAAAETAAAEMPTETPAPPAVPPPEAEPETIAAAAPEPPPTPAPPPVDAESDTVTTPVGEVAVTNNLGSTTPPPPEAPPVAGWPTQQDTPPPPTAPESPEAAATTEATIEAAEAAATADEATGEAVADVESAEAEAEDQTAALPPELPAGESLRITFPAESADLPPEVLPQLDAIAEKLLGDEAMRLQLMAYASGTEDTASKARRISLSRALAVRAYLISKGIRSTRMDVRALGNNVEGEPADRVDIVAQTP